MGASTYMGIPRDKITWYPTIDPDACTNCGSCLDFCSNDVFVQTDTVMTVAKPTNCVVGCSTCTKFCPVDAITFPDIEDLKAQLAELRKVYRE